MHGSIMLPACLESVKHLTAAAAFVVPDIVVDILHVELMLLPGFELEGDASRVQAFCIMIGSKGGHVLLEEVAGTGNVAAMDTSRQAFGPSFVFIINFLGPDSSLARLEKTRVRAEPRSARTRLEPIFLARPIFY